MIGFCMTGSFCTHEAALEVLEKLANYYEIVPIMSETAYETDTRFGLAADRVAKVEKLCGRRVIRTIRDAEPLGPVTPLDAMIILPCTGNTLSKLAHGITDTSVTMAAKAHLRCGRPLVIALFTNDALSANLKNIGTLLARKNVYFLPMTEDDPVGKPFSLTAELSYTKQAIEYAMKYKQIMPLFVSHGKKFEAGPED